MTVGGGGLAGDGRGEHHPGDRQAVALDDAGQHLAQLLARRVVGVVAELLDAVGQRRVGEHDGDALHRAVDPALARRRRGSPSGVASPLDDSRSSASRWSSSRPATAAVSSSSDVCADRPVEQPERLQPGLHLIHGRATLSACEAAASRPAARRRRHDVNILPHGHRGARRRQQGLRQWLPRHSRPQPGDRRQRVPGARRSVGVWEVDGVADGRRAGDDHWRER